MKEMNMVLDGRFGWIHPYKAKYLLDENWGDKKYFCTKVIPNFFGFESSYK